MIPVILAGGSGSRLWPLSRSHYPKQLLSLCGNKTLLQLTVERALKLNNCKKIIIITNAALRFLIKNQIAQYQAHITIDILIEPASLNTAPAIALATQYAAQQSDDLLCFMPADHFIQDDQAFCNTINNSKPFALDNYIITFGIKPAYAETGYGYIQCGEWLLESHCATVKTFTEKPSEPLAEQYYQDNEYYWNSGIFVCKTSHMLNEIKQFQPKIFETTQAATQYLSTDLGLIYFDKKSMANCPSISIDYAIMEHSKHVAMCPMNTGWSDIGSWDAVYQLESKDEHNNVIKGDVITNDARNCYIQSETRLVCATDIKDIVLVETSDAVLIANKNNTQSVKQIVEKLKSLKREEAENSNRVYRPWGYYETLLEQIGFKVKRVVVNPNCHLSLQSHEQRSEHWVVVSGTADVIVGDTASRLQPNQSTYIPIQAKHRLSNPSNDKTLSVIEVQVGNYLGEDDIKRFDDIYGRVSAMNSARNL